MSEMNEKKGFGIFLKILFSSLLVPILAILGTSYIIYNAQIERTENLETTFQLQSKIIETDVKRWSEMNKKVLLDNREDEDIRSLQEFRQKPILNSIKNTYEWLFLATTIGSDGYMTARSDDNPILNDDGSKKHYRGDRQFFKDIQQGRQFAHDVVLSRTTNKPVYVLCAPFDTSAFCFAMNLTNISENILRTKIGKTGFAFMVDNNNRLIAYGGDDTSLRGALEDMSLHPAVKSDLRNKPLIYEENGKKIVSYTTNIENNWTLVFQQDYDEAYAKSNNARNIALVIFAITILFTLFLTIIISRSLSKPIVELTKITNGYSKGEILNGPVPGINRKDEIGSLARGITRMGKSIEVMLKRVYEK